MLRMQNVIYERGSVARQTAAGASAGAGPGPRRQEENGALPAKAGGTRGVSHKRWDLPFDRGLAGSWPEPEHRRCCRERVSSFLLRSVGV